MRSGLAIAGAALVAMVFQTTVFPRFGFESLIVPNLVLVLVVHLGLHHHGASGAVGAFLLGYFLDTFAGTALGVHAFACTVAYGAVVLVAQTVWVGAGVPAAFLVFGAGCVHALATATVGALMEASGGLWRHALRYGVLDATAAALLSPFVFRFLAWEKRLLGAD
jgi:rod shape-determining protein MreD